jgi:hypothetical protein
MLASSNHDKKAKRNFFHAPNGLGYSLMKLVGHWMVMIYGQGNIHIYILPQTTCFHFLPTTSQPLTHKGVHASFSSKSSHRLRGVDESFREERRGSCLSRVWVGAATLDSWLGMYSLHFISKVTFH